MEPSHRSQTDLQHEVLSYLNEFGPLIWGDIYVRFDSGSGEVGRVLKDLQEHKYIEIGRDSMVSITALGLSSSTTQVPRLQNDREWARRQNL